MGERLCRKKGAKALFLIYGLFLFAQFGLCSGELSAATWALALVKPKSLLAPVCKLATSRGNADRVSTRALVCETERIARSCIGWQHLTVVRLRCAGGPGNLFNPTKAHSYSTVGLHLKPDALHSLSGRVHACVSLRVRACICSCVCVCIFECVCTHDACVHICPENQNGQIDFKYLRV